MNKSLTIKDRNLMNIKYQLIIHFQGKGTKIKLFSIYKPKKSSFRGPEFIPGCRVRFFYGW
jgi:hypothetical protein